MNYESALRRMRHANGKLPSFKRIAHKTYLTQRSSLRNDVVGIFVDFGRSHSKCHGLVGFFPNGSYVLNFQGYYDNALVRERLRWLIPDGCSIHRYPIKGTRGSQHALLWGVPDARQYQPINDGCTLWSPQHDDGNLPPEVRSRNALDVLKHVEDYTEEFVARLGRGEVSVNDCCNPDTENGCGDEDWMHIEGRRFHTPFLLRLVEQMKRRRWMGNQLRTIPLFFKENQIYWRTPRSEMARARQTVAILKNPPPVEGRPRRAELTILRTYLQVALLTHLGFHVRG